MTAEGVKLVKMHHQTFQSTFCNLFFCYLSCDSKPAPPSDLTRCRSRNVFKTRLLTEDGWRKNNILCTWNDLKYFAHLLQQKLLKIPTQAVASRVFCQYQKENVHLNQWNCWIKSSWAKWSTLIKLCCTEMKHWVATEPLCRPLGVHAVSLSNCCGARWETSRLLGCSHMAQECEGAQKQNRLPSLHSVLSGHTRANGLERMQRHFFIRVCVKRNSRLDRKKVPQRGVCSALTFILTYRPFQCCSVATCFPPQIHRPQRLLMQLFFQTYCITDVEGVFLKGPWLYSLHFASFDPLQRSDVGNQTKSAVIRRRWTVLFSLGMKL